MRFWTWFSVKKAIRLFFMSHPLIRLPQCYDPERAAAALPPNASRLKVVSHSLAAVLSLPRRLRNPPPRHSRLEYAAAGDDEA